MTENEIIHKREAQIEFLNKSIAFQRMCNNLKQYQEILRNIADEKKEEIINKVKDIYICFCLNDLSAQDDDIYQEEISKILLACEENNFDPKQLANLLIDIFSFEAIKKEFDPQPDKIEKANGSYNLNELLCCEISKIKDEKNIELHIIPNNIKGTDTLIDTLIEKILQGFSILKNELVNGSLQDTKFINMKSWLLSPAFQKKIILLFNNKINDKIVKCDINDISTYGSIHEAFLYNQRAFREFLLENKIPEVYQLKLTKEEFLSTFKI